MEEDMLYEPQNTEEAHHGLKQKLEVRDYNNQIESYAQKGNIGAIYRTISSFIDKCPDQVDLAAGHLSKYLNEKGFGDRSCIAARSFASMAISKIKEIKPELGDNLWSTLVSADKKFADKSLAKEKQEYAHKGQGLEF